MGRSHTHRQTSDWYRLLGTSPLSHPINKTVDNVERNSAGSKPVPPSTCSGEKGETNELAVCFMECKAPTCYQPHALYTT